MSCLSSRVCMRDRFLGFLVGLCTKNEFNMSILLSLLVLLAEEYEWAWGNPFVDRFLSLERVHCERSFRRLSPRSHPLWPMFQSRECCSFLQPKRDFNLSDRAIDYLTVAPTLGLTCLNLENKRR